MLPHAYQQQRNVVPTRIDLILQLYDKALTRLIKAQASLERGEPIAAATTLSQVQLIVTALASGLDGNNPVSANYLRLYEFIVHKIARPELQAVADAHRILESLRDGFEAIRQEALRLEREGQIPPLAHNQMLSITA